MSVERMADKHLTDSRISRQIRARMAAAGMTQIRAAELAGMTQPGLSRTITGSRQWRVDEVIRLAESLGCTVEDLVR